MTVFHIILCQCRAGNCNSALWAWKIRHEMVHAELSPSPSISNPEGTSATKSFLHHIPQVLVNMAFKLSRITTQLHSPVGKYQNSRTSHILQPLQFHPRTNKAPVGVPSAPQHGQVFCLSQACLKILVTGATHLE